MTAGVPGMGQGQDWGAALARSSFGAGALALDGRARRDLAVYYAYCRAIDDCADEYAPAQAAAHLRRWKRELDAVGAGRPTTALGAALAELCARRRIPLHLLEDLRRGALSDARPRVRHERYRDVSDYCYRVAGSVGLACLPIFGVGLEAGRDYALALGEGFQLINILRDVREDAALGRLYFAVQDLRDHGLAPATFLAGEGGARSERLLAAYAWKARAALARADRAASGLPRRGLRPSRLMRAVYGGLLEVMAADGLRVFERRYALGARDKFWRVARGLAAP